MQQKYLKILKKYLYFFSKFYCKLYSVLVTNVQIISQWNETTITRFSR